MGRPLEAAEPATLPSRELLVRGGGSCRTCWVLRREPCAAATATSSCELAASIVVLESLGRRAEGAAVLRELGAAPDPDWSCRLDEVRGGATGGMCRRRSDEAVWYSAAVAPETATGEARAAREPMGELDCDRGVGLSLALFLREGRREDGEEAPRLVWLAW